jgi:hypothetical protein
LSGAGAGAGVTIADEADAGAAWNPEWSAMPTHQLIATSVAHFAPVKIRLRIFKTVSSRE